jgi:hypothetical protein
MTARKTLVATAAALAFIPALSLSAGASTLPAGRVAANGAYKHGATATAGAWEKKCRPRGSCALQLYISAPYQDNGVTVVNLWWTAPPGATSFSLTAKENTGDGGFSYTATGLPQSGPSTPFIVQVEGDTTLFSATFQVTDNEGDTSNTVTYP